LVDLKHIHERQGTAQEDYDYQHRGADRTARREGGVEGNELGDKPNGGRHARHAERADRERGAYERTAQRRCEEKQRLVQGVHYRVDRGRSEADRTADGQRHEDVTDLPDRRVR
jgi:hypothetical protein